MELINPLLSIVIPTKDRYKYLIPLLELLDSYKLKNTEIVIEDNSENNEQILSYFINRNLSIPIKYNYTKESLPICKNLDNAINHSNGKYICCIGDDDAVTPLIEDCIHIMQDNNIESIRQKFEITYKWPSFTDDSGVRLGGTLTYKKPLLKYHKVDLKSSVKSVIANGFQSLGTMPCVYQGIVRRDVLDKLYSINRTYFPGPSPDMANATALSIIVSDHYITELPIIISGGSEFQGGKTKNIKRPVQPLDKVPFISDEAKRLWDDRLPYFWCKYTVWPESGIKGLHYVKQDDLVNELFNSERLLKKCLYLGSEFKNEIYKKSRNVGFLRMNYGVYYLREELAKMKRWLFNFCDILPKNVIRKREVMNIAQAVKIIIENFNSKNAN